MSSINVSNQTSKRVLFTMKTYKKYKTIDFLKDESFLSSVLLSSEEDILFWDDFVSENPDKKAEVERAKQILLSMHFNDDKFTEREKIEIWEQIGREISVLKKKKRYLNVCKIAVAACILGVISIGCFLFFTGPSTKEIVKSEVNPEFPLNKNTQLILANEETIVFEEDDIDIMYKKGGKVITGGNKEVVAVNVDAGKRKCNKLIVPKGRKASFLTLEDGTKVWVNSGSTLEFPVSFEEHKREVFVDGEIYIEVTKDAKRPFFVRTSEMNVKVLGTRFDVSAYKNDISQSVILVEGVVEVQSKDESKKKILLPDYMLTMTSSAMNITKANTYDYISWKDGLLQFRSQQLSVILAKLSRYYDVNIECESDIKNMRCTGKLILFDDVQDVLEAISRTITLEKTISNGVPITYEINGKQVYISRK